MSLSPRRAATRRRVIDAAIEVFGAVGVQAATVEQICEQAGFTRGAFYSNFESKADLCAAILLDQSAVALEAARVAVDNACQNPSTDIESVVGQAIDAFLDAANIDTRVLLIFAEVRLLAARNPDLNAALGAAEIQEAPIFAELLDRGLEDHGFRLTTPISDMIRILHAVHTQIYLDQLRTVGHPDRAELGRLMAGVMRAMIVPA